jgi:hypothetical protein
LFSRVRITAASMSSWVSGFGGTGQASNSAAAMPASAVPAKTLRQWGHFLRGAGGAAGASAAPAGAFRPAGRRGRFDLL